MTSRGAASKMEARRGRRAGLLGLPSCEVLEVAPRGGGEALLVPLVRTPFERSTLIGRLIEVDLVFLGEAVMQVDVFTLFPGAFAWFCSQRHVANAIALGHGSGLSITATTRR